MKKKLSPNKRKNRIINKQNDRISELNGMLADSLVTGIRSVRTFESLLDDYKLLAKENEELLEYKAKYFNLIKNIKI